MRTPVREGGNSNGEEFVDHFCDDHGVIKKTSGVLPHGWLMAPAVELRSASGATISTGQRSFLRVVGALESRRATSLGRREKSPTPSPPG
jgi:hypothetical protein